MKSNQFLSKLGPGILFASTAIGVSHLVQSTRAGADYGLTLIVAILLANLFKFPFFDAGSRYARVTGTTLIDGYRSMGRWVFLLYIAITVATMFFVMSAITMVTAGFLGNLLQFVLPDSSIAPNHIMIGVLCVPMIFLTFGGYVALDKVIKVIAFILLATTVISFILVLYHGPNTEASLFPDFPLHDEGKVLFLIGLMGWMPTAVDMSSWNSLWTLDKMKARKEQGLSPLSLKEVITEFRFSYWISAFLSICFVVLGAYVMYGSEVKFADSGAQFSGQVVQLYTSVLGDWTWVIIALSGFSIMMGTTIGVMDGYARAFKTCLRILLHGYQDATKTDPSEVLLKNNSLNHGEDKHPILLWTYRGVLYILSLGVFIVVYQFGDSFKQLIDFTTGTSFLVAPVVAFMNIILIEKHIPEESQPSRVVKVLSYAGFFFLLGFAVYFVSIKFF